MRKSLWLAMVVVSGCVTVAPAPGDEDRDDSIVVVSPDGAIDDSGLMQPTRSDAESPDAESPSSPDAGSSSPDAERPPERDASSPEETDGGPPVETTDAEMPIEPDAGPATPDATVPDASEPPLSCEPRATEPPAAAIRDTCSAELAPCFDAATTQAEANVCFDAEPAECTTCLSDAAWACATNLDCGALVGDFDCCLADACPTNDATCRERAAQATCLALSDELVACVTGKVDDGTCPLADPICTRDPAPAPDCSPRLAATPSAAERGTCTADLAGCIDAATTREEADACTAVESDACLSCLSTAGYACSTRHGCSDELGAYYCCFEAACPGLEESCVTSTSACVAEEDAYVACVTDRFADGTCAWVAPECVM